LPQIRIEGGNKTLLTVSAIGGGGGGGPAANAGEPPVLVSGGGGGSGSLVTAEFILDTPVTLLFTVGAGGTGGVSNNATPATDGSPSTVQILPIITPNTSYLVYSSGGFAGAPGIGGRGYFGGGSGAVGYLPGFGTMQDGYAKDSLVNPGNGGGGNGGIGGADPSKGGGGGSGPTIGYGGNGSNTLLLGYQAKAGSFGGGGGGGGIYSQGGVVQNGAHGGDGMITFSYYTYTV